MRPDGSDAGANEKAGSNRYRPILIYADNLAVSTAAAVTAATAVTAAAALAVTRGVHRLNVEESHLVSPPCEAGRLGGSLGGRRA